MSETIERTFSTPEGCDLLVKNVRGTVSVEGWDRPETQVVAHRHGERGEVEIYQEGRRVVARTKSEHPEVPLGWFGRHSDAAVDYTVRVPHASDLELKNVNGPIEVAQVQGKVRANNVDGSVSFQDVAGQARAETVNGPIHVTHAQGEAALKAVNGRIEVRSSDLRRLKTNAVNGQLEVTTTGAADGRYDFHTVNGNCHLVVPPDTSARISVHGINSHVECSLPARSVSRSFGNWEGTIGRGEGKMAEITFHTVNGRLRLDGGESGAGESTPFVAKAEPAMQAEEFVEPPEPPEPPEPAVYKVAEEAGREEPETRQPASKAEVLQMVETGEITVDQALDLLRQL